MRAEAIKGIRSSWLILAVLVEKFNKHIRENQKASGRRSQCS